METHTHWSLLQRLIGRWTWSPPQWLHWLWLRKWQVLATLALVAATSYGIYRWVTRPIPVPPEAISVTLNAPSKTDYSRSPKEVSRLSIDFGGSAAPIELLEKAARGVQLEPALAGEWTWVNDRSLQFLPSDDWPVGQALEVKLDEAQAIAPGVILAPYELTFTTTPFSASIASAEFYQDPQDSGLKKAVFGLEFSHPVDAQRLEASVRATMQDGAGRAAPNPQLQVIVGPDKLKAWVHTQSLTLQPNGGVVDLLVEPNVVSSLGGDPIGSDLQSRVSLPDLYSVVVESVEPTLVDNERFEPDQVLILAFNQTLKNTDVVSATKAWLLPMYNPNVPRERQSPPYRFSPNEIDAEVLKASVPIDLKPDPSEREFIEVHSFRYQAPPNRLVYVRIEKGLKSFGGFLMGQNHAQVLTVPEFPRLLSFVGEGSLLSLRGERRVTVISRNLDALRLEVGRVVPDQLHHLVQFNDGTYQQPGLWNIGEDSLVEREEKRLKLPNLDPAKNHYEGVDLSPFFSPTRHGVFLLSLRTMSDDDASLSPAETIAADAGEVMDSRLVVLTDLGVIAKRSLDGGRDVFVQSLSSGQPVRGARVRAIARNGETLVSSETDAGGRASLPTLDGYRREKEPKLLTVQLGEDLSFLPLGDYARALDTSRFEVGGEINTLDPGKLSAFLFSDRGLYRPGDTINLGLIVRAADWRTALEGLPLELDLNDPRGTLVKRVPIQLDGSGFNEFSHAPRAGAPSGTYTAALYLTRVNQQRINIGNVTMQVREFQPDTLRVRATLSAARSEGWVKPDGLSATVEVQNLFGTPAQQRRVEGSLVLRPAYPSFARWTGWNFYDPNRASDGFDEPLTEQTTNADGVALFDLNLNRYANATYQLSFLTRAFEPGSGRNVAAQAGTLVSDNEFLVGLRSVDDLNYVKRGSKRNIEWVTIGQDVAPKPVDDLRAVLVERRYVSVLTRENSGLYRYVSQERRHTVADIALKPSGSVQNYALKTDQPGVFIVEIRNGDAVLNSVQYQVAGDANVSRSLERNAELQMTLSNNDFAVGEEIEISLRAPYTGSGLITIERERVYAHVWFKADTTSSVQRIRVPADLEGNAYVSVQFLRDPMSSEVFMSPLSYAIAPFSVDRGARTQALTLKAPTVAKPGVQMELNVSTGGATRVVAFAVDEGILQVARYRLADPLDHFFKKKMHDVATDQILDLLLPEFSRLVSASAPGGDGEGAMGKHLNPFKRKSEKPAVWWSGITSVSGSHTFKFAMPDHFNGELRIMAVAVSNERVGIAQTKAKVRGDFVLTPTVPTHVAPGDEFELPVGIAHTIEGGDTPLPVALSVKLGDGLSQVGESPAPITIAPGSEGTARVRVKAGDRLGAVAVTLVASSGKFRAQRAIELSVRPAIVERSDLQLMRADRRREIKNLRVMFEQRARREVSASTSPLVAMDGVTAYLRDYPHLCTEQLVSQAFPALVARSRPEFARAVEGYDPEGLIAVLRSRQNGEGGLGLWVATPDSDVFATPYAALYLVEARERGQVVPEDLVRSLNRYLESMARNEALSTLAALRARALAAYVLIRQGDARHAPLLGTIREQLDRDHPKVWQRDIAAMLIASSYALLKQDKAARDLAKPLLTMLGASPDWGLAGYVDYYDAGIASAWAVYLAFKHFPEESQRVSIKALEALMVPLQNNRYNTLSSALITLALDAYSEAVADQGLPVLKASSDGKAWRVFGAAQGQLMRGAFSGSDTLLSVEPPRDVPAWAVLTQNGFDKAIPAATQTLGIEVLREYLDDAGQPIAQASLGQEITVRLRLRSLGATQYTSIAVIDLLPGAFEPITQLPPPDDSSDPGADVPAGTVRLPASTMNTQHIEPREDRIVLYTHAASQVTTFLYKIKPSNPGRFVIPPPYAESMYDRGVYAQGAAAGALEVK